MSTLIIIFPGSLQASTTVSYATLAEAIKDLRQKYINGPVSKVTIDPDDIIVDTIAYYKTNEFDGSRKLRVSFANQPGVDTGGLSRQFFTDATEAIASSPIYKLFEGPSYRKLPAYNTISVHSGLFEVLGRLIGHGILQTSIGYPYLAAPVYWYIATGDIHKALSYASIDDVLDENLKHYIDKVCNTSCVMSSQQYTKTPGSPRSRLVLTMLFVSDYD